MTWRKLACVAAAGLALAGPADLRAQVRYRDTFYLTIRTRDYEKIDPKNPAPAIRAMEARLLELKRELGLDKRKMKYFRVGFQLPLPFREALIRTGTNTNINAGSFHRQVGRPNWKWLTQLVGQDPRYAQWFRDNRTSGGGPVGHHGAVYATFSSYAEASWQAWEARLMRSGRFLSPPDVRDFPVISISGPGEAGINHQVRRRKGQPLTNWGDYSPFAVTEFRDWLTHRGLYARGGRYARAGRAGGKVFADDPAPDKARGSNKTFNQTYGTDFTSWTLKYWDPKKFPRMSHADEPMPDSGKGFVAGGFDAPRDRKDGDAFWDAWSHVDPARPGFRQVMVHHYVCRTLEAIRRGGVPEDRIFSHQIYIPHDRIDQPEHWGLKFREFLDAAPTWTARTTVGHPGFTMYNERALDEQTFRNMWKMLTPAERKYHQFALVEYHPYHLPAKAAGKTKADYAKALALLAKWRPHVVVIESWEGFVYSGHQTMPVKGTPMVEALREMIANWPDKPFWQVPDPSKTP